MAPDVDELIRRVNTLTLDKNRLKQRLSQLTNGSSNSQQQTTTNINSTVVPASRERDSAILLNQQSNDSIQSSSSETCDLTNTSNLVKNSQNTRLLTTNNNRIVAGVECVTSCEQDTKYVNELYRKRLDEYTDNWELLQSKCSALLSELNALQKHYVDLKRENLALEEKLQAKCDDCDKIQGELQTVVLNYETQLSAMSEHLSMITSKQAASLADD